MAIIVLLDVRPLTTTNCRLSEMANEKLKYERYFVDSIHKKAYITWYVIQIQIQLHAVYPKIHAHTYSYVYRTHTLPHIHNCIIYMYIYCISV